MSTVYYIKQGNQYLSHDTAQDGYVSFEAEIECALQCKSKEQAENIGAAYLQGNWHIEERSA